MKKYFEIGKKYYDSGLHFEITGKTQKTISYKVIQHHGQPNERIVEKRKSKIQDWGNREVFFYGSRTIDAAYSPQLVSDDEPCEFVDDVLLGMYFN